jgi:UDP-glucose 4-epimerase
MTTTSKSREAEAALGNKDVLVTGAAGFIGSALCARLKNLGAQVHSASRRTDGPAGADRHWQIDLAEQSPVDKLVSDVRPAYVFHLASHVMGAPDLKHVLPTFRGNLQSSVNLMYSLVDKGCTRMVTIGSLVEPDPGMAQNVPSSPYAAAKWASGDYARMFHALYGLPVAIARVFMVYGPGQQDESKLVPYVTRCVLAGESPQITSGTRQIDWIYVDDVVEGLLKLATATKVDGKTADLGSGSLISTSTLVNTICDLVSTQSRPVFGALPDRPLEPLRVARVQETTDLIGWVPRISLQEGLSRTIEWYRNHPAT